MNLEYFLLVVAAVFLGGCGVYVSQDECGPFTGSRASCEFHMGVQSQVARMRYQGF